MGSPGADGNAFTIERSDMRSELDYDAERIMRELSNHHRCTVEETFRLLMDLKRPCGRHTTLTDTEWSRVVEHDYMLFVQKGTLPPNIRDEHSKLCIG